MTRIVSESTGLVKFNITKRVIENEKLNEEFSQVEQAVYKESTGYLPSQGADISSIDSEKKVRIIRKSKSGLNLDVSPKRTPQRPVHEIPEDEDSTEALLLTLASKQRKALEYKQKMEQLKALIAKNDIEIKELQNKCNINVHTSSNPLKSTNDRISNKPTNPTLRPRSSISQLKSSFESTNFNLKKRLSTQQLNAKQSVPFKLNQDIMNQNFKTLQKDTNQLIEKGLNFMNTLRMNINKSTQEQEDDYDDDFNDSDSDVSNYGSADTSDYALAVK